MSAENEGVIILRYHGEEIRYTVTEEILLAFFTLLQGGAS